MANRLQARSAEVRGYLRFSLLLLLCLGAPGLQAEIISDLLIVLEPDGRHYVAQHTLATDGILMVAELPATRISLETRFAGSERLTFATAHELNPEQLSLWSGSAWTRYRHYYEAGLSEPDTGVFELSTDLEHAALKIEESGDVQWSLSWILPDNARVTDFQASAAKPSATMTAGQDGRAPAASWQTSGQVLTFRQSGGKLPTLRIRYSLNSSDSAAAHTCQDVMGSDDPCAQGSDSDSDAVPDFRDVCLPPASDVIALRPPVPATQQHSVDSRARMLADDLGCAHDDPQLLSGVHFRSGQYYLDVASRRVLDRVAHALQRIPEQRFEIGSHTDNAGRVDVNLRLSEGRAKAVSHYLQLRGVGAGQLEARGYGESLPAYDKTEPAGRRANRRTELRRID